jgi:hypothetical protein
MVKRPEFGALAILSLFLVSSAGQEHPSAFRLMIRHDGKPRPAPSHVVLSFDNQSATLCVRDGRFEVPAGAVGAKEVTLGMVLDGEEVRLSGLSGKEFQYEEWMLLLADHDYGEDHRYAVPKGARIRPSCLLELESVNIDPGLVIFETQCRSNRNQRTKSTVHLSSR